MCQFARLYPLNILRSFIETDSILSVPNIQNITNEVLKLNSGRFTQELTAQIQSADNQSLEITQETIPFLQIVSYTNTLHLTPNGSGLLSMTIWLAQFILAIGDVKNKSSISSIFIL